MENGHKDTKDILAKLPRDLEAALRTEAKREHRSRNKQLVVILQERYQPVAATREQMFEAAN